ncbi:hypothetical protein [Blautia sp.]|uniref:hypothetical protein n=1 Tax=Blautia sp. TaxID=1955243 RepID=UPI00280A765B|nr:hypothetical protein [Blautia sp.]
MKNSMKMLLTVSTAVALTFSGCGKSSEPEAEPTVPAAAPTAVPTAVPATATPAPTSTPAPRSIGEKNSKSKYVYLTNNLSTKIREFYLMVSGEDEWGENLIPSETSIKKSEQVQLFYTPESDSHEEETVSEDETADSENLYDMKIVTADGDIYEIYSVELGDMEKAVLTYDQDMGVAYLRYMSLTDKKEKDTKENSQQTGASDDYSEEDDQDDESYDNGNSDNGSSDDGSSDDGSSDDESSDGGSNDNGNSDDGDSDDGNSDDGNSDDGNSDDGNYDDGNYDDGGNDDGMVDGGGSDDGNYDTAE